MTFATLRGVCGCGSSLIPSSRATDGLATEYCGTCRIESLTTLRGAKHLDQRARFEQELLADLRRDTAPANPKYQHGRTWKSLDV